MRQRRTISTTLGDFIVAVTDEVQSFIRDPSDVYMVVSYIVSDLAAEHRMHVRKQTDGAPCLVKDLKQVRIERSLAG
jgi:hypothetical protein